MIKGENLRKSRIGLKIGKILIVGFEKNEQQGCYLYKCQCDCGKVSFINWWNINHNMGCGCSRGKQVKGDALKSFYTSFKGIAKRRGIDFKLSFEQFTDLAIKRELEVFLAWLNFVKK